MIPETNHTVILSRKPEGRIDMDLFKIVKNSIPQLKEGQVLVKTLILSIDPAIIGRLRDDDNYVENIQAGETVPCYGLGQVIESRASGFKKGQIVFGNLGMQELTVLQESELRKINPALGKLSWNLHVLGIAGITAYFGLLDVGQPRRGETVVVSAAAGSVGSLVGQIAKMKGCRVVGITGSEDKMKYLTEELNFDAAVNYRDKDFAGALKKSCPDGIDVYFDNVAGDLSNVLLPLYNIHARIVLCGRMSLAHLPSSSMDVGMRDTTTLIRKRMRKQGFVIIDYENRYTEAILFILSWIIKGKIKIREEIWKGLHKAPEALVGLTKGVNTGKLLVEVAEYNIQPGLFQKIAASLLMSRFFPHAFIATLIRLIFKRKNY